MRVFDWVISHLYWVIGATFVVFVFVAQWEPEENQELKKQVVEGIAPAGNLAIGDTLTIDMKRVVTLPWDTLYMFCGTTIVDRISATIGATSPIGDDVHEDDNLLVFMYKGQIADYVIFRGFNYQQEPNFVKFEGHFNTGELFTPMTARFRATRAQREPHWITLYAPRALPIYRPGYSNYLAKRNQARLQGVPEPPLPID